MQYLEFFAGIGGFRRGLECLGHQCVGWVEIDKFARQSYEAIWPEAAEEWNAHDITTVTDDAIRRLARDIGAIDLIAGGFPCQAFSVAGKRGGFEDTRGTLFFEIARIAVVLKPKYLLLENVVGLLNHDEGRTFHTILCALDELGYDVEWQVFNATDFGIPQNRERVFIVGHLRGHGGRKVFPLLNDGGEDSPSLHELTQGVSQTSRVYGADGVSPTLRHGSDKTGLIAPMIQVSELKELTQGVADAHRVYDAQGVARTLKSEGGGLGDKTGLYEVSKTVRASGQGSYDGKHTWNLVQVGVVRNGYGSDAIYSERDVALTIDANYHKGLDAHQARTGVMVRAINDPSRPNKTQNGRRLKEDGEPMFTLTAQDKHGVMIYQKASRFENNNHLVSETRIRRLTPKECWRLMGRKDWEFERAKASGVSDSQLYKQAGNSLVPQIVTAIAEHFE